MWGEVRSVWTLFLLLVIFNGDLLLVESRGISTSSGEECPCIPRDQCPRIYGKSALDIRELGFMSACSEFGTVRCCGVSISVVQKNSGNFMNPATDLNTLNNDDGDLVVSETIINQNEALPTRRKKIVRRRRPGATGNYKNSSTTIASSNQIEGQKYEENPAENENGLKKETTTFDETSQISSEKPRNPLLNGKRTRPLRPIRPISSQQIEKEPIVEQPEASSAATPETEIESEKEPSPEPDNTQTLEASKTGYVHKSPPKIRPFHLRRRPNITRLSSTNVVNEEHTEVLPESLPVEPEKPVESHHLEQSQPQQGYDKVISEAIPHVKIKPIQMRRRPLSSISMTTSEAPSVEYPSSTEYIHNPSTISQNVPEKQPNEKYERTTTTEESVAQSVVGSHYNKNGYSSQEQIPEAPQKQSLRKRLKPFRKFPSKQHHLPLVEEQKSEENNPLTTTAAAVVPYVEEAPKVEYNHNYGSSPSLLESQKEEIVLLPSSTEKVFENIPTNSEENSNSYGGESSQLSSKPEQISSMGHSIVLDHIKDGVVVLDERNSFVDKKPIIIQAATDAPLQPQPQPQLQLPQTPLTKRRRILSHRPPPTEIEEQPKTSKPINIHSENNHVRIAGRPASTSYAYSNAKNEDPVRMTSQYSRIRLGNEENEENVENDASVNTLPAPQPPILNEGKRRFSISNIFSKTTTSGGPTSVQTPSSEDQDDQNENYDLILDQDNRKEITPQQQLLKIRNPGYYPSAAVVEKKEKVLDELSEAVETRTKQDYGNNNNIVTRKELISPQSLLKRVKVSKEPVNSYSQQVQVSTVSNQQQLQQKKHQKSRISPNMRIIKRPASTITQTPNLNLKPKARPESYSTEQVGQVISSQKQYPEQTQVNNNENNTSNNDGYESTTQKFIFPPFKRTKVASTSVNSGSNYNAPPVRVRSTTSAPTTVTPVVQVFANQYQQSTESSAEVQQIYPTTTEYAIVRAKPEIIYQHQAPSTSTPEVLNVKVSTKYESAVDLPVPHKSSTSHRFKVPDSFFSTPDLQPQTYYKPPIVEEHMSYIDKPVVEDSRPHVKQKQRIRIKVKDDQQKQLQQQQQQHQQQTKGYVRFPAESLLPPKEEAEEIVKPQIIEQNITEQPKYEQNIPQQQKFEQNIPQPQQNLPEQQHTFITPAMTTISFGTEIDGKKNVQNLLPTPVPSPSPIPLFPKHHVTSSEIVHQPDLIKESEKTQGQIPLFHQQQKLQQPEIVHHHQRPLHPEIFNAKPVETSLPAVSQPPAVAPISPSATPFFSNFDQGNNKTHTYIAFGTQLENEAKTSFRPQHQLPIQQPQVQTLIKQQLKSTPQIPASVNHQYFLQPQSQQIQQQYNIHKPIIQNQGLQSSQQQQQQFLNNHQYTKQERLPTIYNHQQQVHYHNPSQHQLLKINSYHQTQNQNQNHYQMPPQHIQFGTQIQQQQSHNHNMNQQHFPMQPQQTHVLSQKEIVSRPGQLKNEYQHHLSITEQILSRLKNTIRMSRATNVTLMEDNGISGGQEAPEPTGLDLSVKEQSSFKKPPTTKMENGIIGAVEVIRKLTSQPVVTKVEHNKQEKSKLSAKSTPISITKSVNSTKPTEIEPQQFPGIPIPPEKNEFQPPKVIQGGFMPIVPYYSSTDPGPKLVKVNEEQKLIKDEKIASPPKSIS